MSLSHHKVKINICQRINSRGIYREKNDRFRGSYSIKNKGLVFSSEVHVTFYANVFNKNNFMMRRFEEGFGQNKTLRSISCIFLQDVLALKQYVRDNTQLLPHKI